MAQFEIVEQEGQKMVKATLEGETVRAESGALHYLKGNVEMESRMPSAGGIFKSFMSGETAFKPTYKGTGEVYFGPPMFGEYEVLDLQDEEWIVDQGAYVCSDEALEVSAFRNKAGSALLGGEGWFQTSVKGTGRAIVQAPGKVHRMTLQGERLAVDGSFAIARTAGVDYSVQRASRSMVGSFTSGEGLLSVFEGTGTVLVAPVPNLHESLVEKCRPPMPNQGGQRSAGPMGQMIGLVIAAVVLLGMCGVAIVAMVLSSA